MKMRCLLIFAFAILPLFAQGANFKFDPLGAIFKRSFSKDPVHVMTCELFLKSRLDAFAATQDITLSLEILAKRLNQDLFDYPASGRRNKSTIDFFGGYDQLTSKQKAQIGERLSVLAQDQKSEDIFMDRVAYEIRGEDIFRALDFIEQNENQYERDYAAARLATFNDPPLGMSTGWWTASVYLKWSILNLGLIGGLFAQPAIALPFAVVIHGALTPIYWWRSMYNRSRTDSGFAQFKRVLRDWVANPKPDQFLMTSRSFTVSPRAHQALFSPSATSDQVVEGRQEAVRLYGGSFVRNFMTANWGYHGVSPRIDPFVDLADFKVFKRTIYVDRLIYTNDKSEPVFVFSYRSFASVARRGRSKPVERPAESLTPAESPGILVPSPAG